MIRAAVGIYVSGSQSRHQEHRRHIFLRCQETCTTTAVGLYNSRRGSHQRRTYLHRVVAAVFPPADKRHKLHTPSASLQQRLRETKAASTGLLSSSQCLWRSAGSLLANALLTTTGLTMPAMHFGFCHAPVAPLLLLRLCVAVHMAVCLSSMAHEQPGAGRGR